MAVEMSSKDTAQIIRSETGCQHEWGNKLKLLTFFTATAGVISVIALIIAFVAVARNGTNEYYIGGTSNANTSSKGTTNTMDNTAGTINGEKIWMLQIGHFQSNTQYLDEESGTIQGYNVDVVNAVCQLANKNCALVWDIYENCWNSQVGERPRGGTGLMSRWYDACVGWIITSDRSRTLRFTNEFEKRVDVSLWVNSGGSLPGADSNMPDLSNLKVGFVDGWFSDEHCLARYDEIIGFNQLDNDQVIHYPDEASLIAAMNRSEISTAFLSVRPSRSGNDSSIQTAWIPDDNKCLLGGIAVMTQKDQLDFLTWWNYAFERLRVTSQYKDICRRLETDHGDQPGFTADDVCV